MTVSAYNICSLDPFIDYCFGAHATVAGAQAFVDTGVDVTAFDPHGYTALHAASIHGNIDLCAYLIGLGADMNARLKPWQDDTPSPGEPLPTPLGLAVQCLQSACALMLLEKGADPNIPICDVEETGPMHRRTWTVLIAAMSNVEQDKGMIDVIDALFANGVDLHAPMDGEPPLHYARTWCASSVVPEMLENRIKERYVTPLEKEALRRTDAIVRQGTSDPLKPAPRIRIRKPGGAYTFVHG
jgi:hypothetical protein